MQREILRDLRQPTEVVNGIVSLGKSMSLEVNSDDVKELVKKHSTELSTDELKLLLQKQQKEVLQRKRREGGDVPSALIKEMCAKLW